MARAATSSAPHLGQLRRIIRSIEISPTSPSGISYRSREGSDQYCSLQDGALSNSTASLKSEANIFNRSSRELFCTVRILMGCEGLPGFFAELGGPILARLIV